MQMDSNIWGAPATYVNATAGDIWGEFWRTQKVYADILYDNPTLRYPFYEKSSYRWGIPCDSSAGRLATCSWWAVNGAIQFDIKEPTINSVVGFTMDLSPSSQFIQYTGNDTYNVTYDATLKYPPYQKMNVSIQNIPGNISFSGAVSQSYLHKIRYYNDNGFYESTLTQCAKFNYNKNVLLIGASFINLKGNYSNNELVESDIPAAFKGELDELISFMRNKYNLDIAAGKNVEYQDYSIIGIGGELYTARSASSRIHPQNTTPRFLNFSAYEPSERWKYIYYNDDSIGAVASHYAKQPYVGFGASIQFNPTIVSQNMKYFGNYSSLPTKTTFFNNSTTAYYMGNNCMTPCDCCQPVSSKKQVFSDVSYHWEWCIRTQYKSYRLGFDELPILPNSSSSALYNSIVLHPVLIIDNYDNSIGDYFDACRLACLHEMSFFGLPLCTSYTAATSAMWTTQQESIFIPQFDSHFVTTGNFITLKKSYELDPTGQFDWTDIFAADAAVNNYDPSYQPTPEHGEDDFGDLDNKGGYRIFPTTLNCYALNFTELTQFMYILNGLYLTDPDGNTKWNLDFKGTNPSEYIVAAYATLYDAPLTSAKKDVKLGAVNFTEIAPAYQLYGVGNVEQFDCGSVFLAPYYGDFRDFAPYTSAELYLPLCGSVDIDIPYFLNHYINVVYWIDIYTMSCAASIYRDGTTLYKTISGSCGAQMPLLAPDLANYQNTVHQIEQQQKQNSMRVAAAVIGTTLTAAGLAAAPETMGASVFIAGMGMGITQAVSAASGVQTAFDLNYQLEHIPRTHTEIGAASPQNNFCVGDIIPKLFIKRAKMLPSYSASHYSHVVGNQCCIAGTIGSFSGYTVVGSCDLSGIQATQSELDQIRQLLQTGVYL